MCLDWVLSIVGPGSVSDHGELILTAYRSTAEHLRPRKILVRSAGIGDAVGAYLSEQGLPVEVVRSVTYHSPGLASSTSV